jgi:hypothetical protein
VNPRHLSFAAAFRLSLLKAVTAEMAKGFTLYMLKAILSERGDEIVDLAHELAQAARGAPLKP